MEESDSRLSWYILGFAILALGWGIWLKVNEKGEETGSGEEREWIRLPGGKLVDKHSEEPFEGVRELPFELDPTMIEWEYTYVGGLRHGPAVEYFPGIGKRVKSRSNYLEGTLNGTVTTYYEKGGVASKCEAVDGWLTGLMTFYDRDGRVTQRQVYELSAPTSQAAIIEDPPLTIEEIDEGIVTEEQETVGQAEDPPPPKMLDPEGKPYTGTQIGTFFGGGKAWEHRYRDGLEHGRHDSWNPEGEPEYQREYFDGEPHGRWKHWAESGVLITDESFQYGLQVGSAKRWHPNEQLRQESQFVHGAEHGVRKVFGSSGRPRRETTFDHGIRTHMIEWNFDGSVNLELDTPIAPGAELTLPPADEPATEVIEITDLPDEAEEITIGFRYRLSTEIAAPPLDTVRPFTASLLKGDESQGEYTFDGELGGWHTHQWVVYYTPGETFTVRIDAQPGPIEIHIAGAGLVDEQEPVDELPELEEE